MRKHLTIISALFLFGCNEPEIESKHYPYVVMTDVSTLNEGVEFVAEFKGLGDTPVTRYGFVWWYGDSMDSSDFNVREMESEPTIGNFSLKVTSDLESGIIYQVRPFAQNENSLVFGDIMSFESKSTNPPEFTDFFPKSGKPGDIITIKGSNFSLSKTKVEVLLGSDKGILLSTDANEIKFMVPDKLSRSGVVSLFVKSGGVSLRSKESFSIEGHQIVDFNPKTGIIGETEIVITGNGFLETGNKVFIGGNEVVILDESETAITIRLPFAMKAGIVHIEVDVNGQVASANDIFNLRSRWTRLADFPGTPRINAFSAVIGDFLYVIGGEGSSYSDEVWKYNIVTDNWMQLPSFPGGGRADGLGFTIGNTIYYGLGVMDDFWSFNTTTGQWKQTYSLSSVNYPISTSIDGKGYLLAGWSNGVWSFTEQDGWAYQGIPNDLGIYSTYDNYFEIGGNPYVLDEVTNGNTGEVSYNLYIVNRSNPVVWQFLYTAPFTKKAYNGICFASDHFAYIGDGAYRFNDREFMKLDIATSDWTRIENFQGPLVVRGAISFSHQNKGYTGFGLVYYQDSNSPISSNEFWVYDPSIQ